jgi:predicted naringenin-chalcone synthase
MTDVQSKPKFRHRAAPTAAKHITLLGIGTAAPPSISQEDATNLAEEFSCQTDGQRAWLRRVFSRSGVHHRGTVLQNQPNGIRSFYGPPSVAGALGPTTTARMQRYALEAPPLMERAARDATVHAGVLPEDISHIITVTCTGFFSPGLDVEIISRLKLRPDAHRVQIGFMGCHAAFNALAAARDIVRANPSALVLVCSVELATLHFAYGWQPEKLVANALFADGAAACVVGGADHAGPEPVWQLLDTTSLLLPDSRDAMTWKIGDHGFEMTLSSTLPELIGRHIRSWAEHFLQQHSLTLGDIHHWAIHPGGPRIVAAAQSALALPDTATTASYDVLSQHGNMSSATLLFLLQRLSHEAREPGLCLAIGFGPGLMAEGMLLEI